MSVATAHRIARLDEIPIGEGRAFAAANWQIAVFGYATARSAPSTRPARTRAGRSPTVWLTARW